MPGTVSTPFFGEILEGRLRWEICVHQAHPKCGMIESQLKHFRVEPLKAIQFLILSTAMGFQHVSCQTSTQDRRGSTGHGDQSLGMILTHEDL